MHLWNGLNNIVPRIVRAWDTVLYTFDSYADDSTVSFSNNFVGFFSHILFIVRLFFFSFEIFLSVSEFALLLNFTSVSLLLCLTTPLSCSTQFFSRSLMADSPQNIWTPIVFQYTIVSNVCAILKLCIECEHKLNFLPFLVNFIPFSFVFFIHFFVVVVSCSFGIQHTTALFNFKICNGNWSLCACVCVYVCTPF